MSLVRFFLFDFYIRAFLAVYHPNFVFFLTGRNFGKKIFYFFLNCFLIKISGDYNRSSRSDIMLLTIIQKVFPFHPADIFPSAGHIPSGRLVSIHCFHKNIMDVPVRHILIHVYLFYYHSFFLFYFA